MTKNQVYQIRHPSFSIKGFKLLFIDWKVWQHFKVSCEQYYPLRELNVIFVGFKIAALLLIDLIRHRFENPSVKLKSFPLLSVIYKYRFLWVILNLWRGVTKKLGSNLQNTALLLKVLPDAEFSRKWRHVGHRSR